MSIDLEQLKIHGTKMNYYYICKRKLWLYDKGITMEPNNDRVLSGKLLHEKAYPRMKNRDILIDDIISLDIIENDNVREIKLTSSMPKADRMQLIYYLYYLKSIGVEKKGLINYVKEKRQEVIELTNEIIPVVEEALVDINDILNEATPPKLLKLPYCKKCAYYEFCYAKEE